MRAALDAGIALLEKRHVPHTQAHLADAKVARMPQKLRDALRSERTLEAFVAHEDEGYRAKLKACPACARCAARAEEARTSRQSEGARREKHQASRGGGSEAGGSGRA